MSDETKRTRVSEQLSAVPSPARISSVSHPIRTGRLSTSSGVMAAAAWLAARGLFVAPEKAWRVDVVMNSERNDCRLAIHISQDEWGFELVVGSRASSVRVADIPMVVGRDDHNLLAMTPSLKAFGRFVREIESRYHVHFQRAQAQIAATIAGAEPNVRAWLVSL